MLQSPPWLGWPLWNICDTNDHGYVPFVVSTSWSFPHSRLTTGFVTRLTRRVPLVEQELPTFPGHLSSPPVFSGVRVTRSLVLYVCFVDRCLYFFFWPMCCLFFFDIVIYGFWLPLWYLQTLLRCLWDFCILLYPSVHFTTSCIVMSSNLSFTFGSSLLVHSVTMLYDTCRFHKVVTDILYKMEPLI
jgi:hypothetical protein